MSLEMVVAVHLLSENAGYRCQKYVFHMFYPEMPSPSKIMDSSLGGYTHGVPQNHNCKLCFREVFFVRNTRNCFLNRFLGHPASHEMKEARRRVCSMAVQQRNRDVFFSLRAVGDMRHIVFHR